MAELSELLWVFRQVASKEALRDVARHLFRTRFPKAYETVEGWRDAVYMSDLSGVDLTTDEGKARIVEASLRTHVGRQRLARSMVRGGNRTS